MKPDAMSIRLHLRRIRALAVVVDLVERLVVEVADTRATRRSWYTPPQKGDVPNVVFSAANPVVNDAVHVYYGQQTMPSPWPPSTSTSSSTTHNSGDLRCSDWSDPADVAQAGTRCEYCSPDPFLRGQHLSIEPSDVVD